MLTDALPAVVLTTTAAADAVQKFVRLMPRDKRPRIIAVDAIPDSVGSTFAPVELDSRRDRLPPIHVRFDARYRPAWRSAIAPPVRIFSRWCYPSAWKVTSTINGVSWLPLYHDMGLMMIGFPLLYGGHLTFMSPMAFVRRPLRWIQVLSNESQNCHIVSPAPNFAFESGRAARDAEPTTRST